MTAVTRFSLDRTSCHDGQTCGREIGTVTKENKVKTIEELDKDGTRALELLIQESSNLAHCNAFSHFITSCSACLSLKGVGVVRDRNLKLEDGQGVCVCVRACVCVCVS